MEDSLERKPMHHQDFTCVALADLSPSTSSPPLPQAVTASFSVANSGAPQLRLHQPESVGDVLCFGLRTSQVFNLGPLETLVVVEEPGNSEDKENSSFSKAFKLVFRTPDQRRVFDTEFEHWRHGVLHTQNGPWENGSIMSQSKFDNKIEASSAKMYFHYYGQLVHQQNMLQDYVRTGTYFYAVIENCIDFQDRVVVDVGAGSGILSLFAAQAGAKHVYAVEASEMAEFASRLVAGNPSLGNRITVIKGKIEEVELPEKADILISEPMGTLLVNERMLETYVIARERFLIPNGKMFPSIGRIHMAPFSDEYLFVELANKALFWQQQNFYGVDLTPLYGSAFQGYFSQVYPL